MGELTRDTKLCPYCKEEIRSDAIKCKHCGEFLKIEKEEVKPGPQTIHKSSKALPLIVIIMLIGIVICGGVVLIAAILVRLDGGSDINKNNSENYSYSDSQIDTCDQVEFEYLRSSGCTLYDNYRTKYLAFDELCNSDNSCKGSAKQKEGYETFKTWDSFYQTYCVNVGSTKCSEYHIGYLKTNDCLLYDNFKQQYLTADEVCNSYYSCRGSASQKEAYETFKTWDSFKNTYCSE